MDLSSPIRSVIPSAQGAVLAVLALVGTRLSGRQIAERSGGVSNSGVQRVLAELVESGLVLAEEHPPARLYRLNRDHVAAEAIAVLASLRAAMLERMRDHIRSWRIPPVAVWLFGSAARAEGTTESDLDVFVVRPDEFSDDDVTWRQQVASFADKSSLWTGNDCAIVEVSKSELEDMVTARERLIVELRADAIVLAGRTPHQLLGRGD
ncbi:MAG: nucleotidyltransferase domain-containing protein [Actinomycetia bacterium]|nr:nucleotidyltransferase domain-containing protein [Actinomycetes bacterium]